MLRWKVGKVKECSKWRTSCPLIIVLSVSKVRIHYRYSGSAWGKMELQLCVHAAGLNWFIDDPESELSPFDIFTALSNNPPRFHVSLLLNKSPGKC